MVQDDVIRSKSTAASPFKGVHRVAPPLTTSVWSNPERGESEALHLSAPPKLRGQSRDALKVWYESVQSGSVCTLAHSLFCPARSDFPAARRRTMFIEVADLFVEGNHILEAGRWQFPKPLFESRFDEVVDAEEGKAAR